MGVKLMEPETAKLAVELQLDDINDLLDGLYDEPDIPDGDLRTSFEYLREDLRLQHQILEGHLRTLEIIRLEHEDRIMIQRLIQEEQQAHDDHQFAMRLAGLVIADAEIEHYREYEATLIESRDTNSQEQWESAKKLHAAALVRDMDERVPPTDFHHTDGGVEGSDNHSEAEIPALKNLIQCCACMDDVACEDALTLECVPDAHSYCRDCLVDLFASCLQNTTLFPPRCCKLPIPLEVCRVMLPKALIKDFDLKVDELATPNPTYCANVNCSKFIAPKDIKAEVGSCRFCDDKTCVRCKTPEHEGLCPTDPHVQLLMDLAKRGKWQQCTRCKNVVELQEGCFHMT